MSHSFVRPDILDMEEYEPVTPLEVLSVQLGIPIDRLIKLDGNENPYGPAPSVIAALAGCDVLHIYPDPMQNQMRDALASYTGMPRDMILGGAGSDELIDLVMRLVLRPGDAIINCPPTFGMYSFDAALHGADCLTVRRDDQFRLDLEGIEEAAAGGRARLLFITSPNNPDGSLVTEGELERLLRLPLLLVLDEAYAEFAGSSFMPWVERYPNLIVLRTFSKWAGLAGLRVGYGIFPLDLITQLWKIKQPYNVSVAGQVAAVASVEASATLMDRVNALVEERGRLRAGLDQIAWLAPYPSHANFILCRVVGRPAVDVKLALRRQGILIRHFNKPGVSDCVRFSVGRPDQTDALLAALGRL
jgi:histidinol-phosphate aminotransferase